jgi:hypothetical protein
VGHSVYYSPSCPVSRVAQSESVLLRVVWPVFVPRQTMHSLASASTLALRPTQPPVQWVPGSIPGGTMLPARDADHSPFSTAQVKGKYYLYIFFPCSASMACNGTNLPLLWHNVLFCFVHLDILEGKVQFKYPITESYVACSLPSTPSHHFLVPTEHSIDTYLSRTESRCVHANS